MKQVVNTLHTEPFVQSLRAVKIWVLTISLAFLSQVSLSKEQEKLSSNVSLDCFAFEKQALKSHPILQEQSLDIVEKQLDLEQLKYSAILPKFEVSMATGPAPGVKTRQDTNFLYNSSGRQTSWVWGNQSEFDLQSWGPFFGMEVTVAQPLNVYRYQAGKKARALNIKVSKAEFYKRQMKVSLEAQEVYYGFLLAQKLHAEALKATEDLEEAQELIEEMLDEESESVSQKDLLRLKAGRYELDKGLREAETGLKRARLGSSLFLGLPIGKQGLSSQRGFVPQDSVLLPTKVTLPSLDSLRTLALSHHPDLKRLKYGLMARRELLQVAQGEMGPDFFLFGRFEYSRVWAPKREVGSEGVFSTDPLNRVSGLAGLGLKMHLNFWSRYQNYKKSKLEVSKLEKTEAYAARGILLRLEVAYIKHLKAKGNLESAKSSRRAAEALLKSAAIDYDLDPSLASAMAGPYKDALIAKKNYYQEVYRYNVSLGEVLFAIGWTLSDYLNKGRGEPDS